MWSGARNSEGEILGGLGERGERKGDFSRRGGIYKNVFFLGGRDECEDANEVNDSFSRWVLGSEESAA